MKTTSSAKQRFFAPEIVQTSAMDCGPAALKCLLEGFGVSASYGRLREACQTDVDGTSIDTIEELANQLGLVAEQVMLPVDHLLLPEADALPAIVVVRLPNGFTHFVVAWRNHGDRVVQLMDPATGRRWPTVKQFLDTVYVHTFPVPADGWRDWAGTEEFLAPLRRRMAQIGVDPHSFIEYALVDPSWRGVATLDAAIRLAASLVKAGGLRSGRQATLVLDSMITRSQQSTAVADGPIPAAYWSVRLGELTPDAPPDEMTLLLRGAVLVRIDGLQDEETRATQQLLSPELEAVLSEPPSRPERQLLNFFLEDGLLRPVILLPAILLAALGIIIEAVLFRGLIDLGEAFGVVSQRAGVMTAVLLFIVGLLLLQVRITAHALRLGRQLDLRMRIAFLEKIPRLRDQYFHSRPTSDMAQRSHFIYKMRELPNLGVALLRIIFTLALTVAGIIWLSPEAAPLALVAGVAALGFPIFILPILAERDLRVQTHVGSLSRFFLDSLLGLVPIRAHGAERAVRREHENLLVEWARAAIGRYRTIVWADGGQALLGYGSTIAILFIHLQRGGDIGSILLLTYWALNLSNLGQEAGLILRQYPSYRNVTLRLMEPLGAPEDEMVAADMAITAREPASQTAVREQIAVREQTAVREQCAVRIQMEDVSVRAAGNMILENIDLHIEPGEHVAIVGSSGAGKSSLVGLLLGWHRPIGAATGLQIDGWPLDGDQLARLRPATAWVDPAVQLWNQSFLDNLYYGVESGETLPLSQVLDQADLVSVLSKLPQGLQTPLGESGGLVSGGEGQRVRLGRAMLRPDARLVILDEPFRGLGREQRREMLKRSRQLWQDATLLCITHDVRETLSFERVIVLDEGRIVEDGTPRKLAALSNSLYRALLVAEQRVRKTLWSRDEWRRLHLANGHLSENGSVEGNHV